MLNSLGGPKWVGFNGESSYRCLKILSWHNPKSITWRWALYFDRDAWLSKWSFQKHNCGWNIYIGPISFLAIIGLTNTRGWAMSRLPLLLDPQLVAQVPEGWPFRPFFLVNLMELMTYLAGDHWDNSTFLAQVWPSLKEGKDLTTKNWVQLADLVRELEAEFQRLELTGPLAHIRRIRDAMGCSPVSRVTVGTLIGELHSRVVDDLKLRKFLYVPVRVESYYSDIHLFGSTVSLKFSSATFDLEHAGKCLALGEYTASVFHLMRVAEAGLHALGAFVEPEKYDQHIPPAESWQKILGILKDHLENPKKRSHLQNHYQFLSNAQAQMFAVNKAWRDKTMHLDRKYTEDEAYEIFNAIKGLMRYLAENMP